MTHNSEIISLFNLAWVQILSCFSFSPFKVPIILIVVSLRPAKVIEH